MFNFFKSKYTIDKFNEEMLQEQHKLTIHLKSLINEIGYNDEAVYGGSGIVSCWIIIRSIGDREYIDNFFEYFLKRNFPSKVKEMSYVLSSMFQHLDPYFKQWTKNPVAGSRLAEAILNVINGDDSEKKYGDIECMTVFAFFAEQFKYLLQKQHSLRKKIK